MAKGMRDIIVRSRLEPSQLHPRPPTLRIRRLGRMLVNNRSPRMVAANPPDALLAPPVTSTDNPELATDLHVTRWQAGDESAFELLYQRFAPLLALRVQRNRVWPILRQRCHIDDVVQEVWSKLVSGSKKSFTPSGPGSFLAFLSSICDHTMVDLVRHSTAVKRGQGATVQSLEEDGMGAGYRKPSRATEETPTSRARVSELEAIAKNELSEREFEAWELVEMRDYTAPEAGLAMDTSDSAVRGLLLRGRAKLVMRLGETQ